MTRRKFVDALLDAITTFAGLDGQIDVDSTSKFVDAKIGIFFGVDEDGSKEVQHYILIEFADGSMWRIIPERVLKLEEHEEKLWNQIKEFEDADADEQEDDSEYGHEFGEDDEDEEEPQ
jgi:hypothetical protein